MSKGNDHVIILSVLDNSSLVERKPCPKGYWSTAESIAGVAASQCQNFLTVKCDIHERWPVPLCSAKKALIRALFLPVCHVMTSISEGSSQPRAETFTYQVSINGRFLPSRGTGFGVDLKPAMIQCRVSLGSMTSSISKAVAKLTALPRSYICATRYSYSSLRASVSSMASSSLR